MESPKGWTMHKQKLKLFSFSFFLAAQSLSSTFTNEFPAGRTLPGNDLDAYEVFYSMYDQAINLKAQELYTVGSDRTTPVTFGAEKEGSSSKIMRVMSPSAKDLIYAASADLEKILWFLEGLQKGTVFLNRPVYNKDGQLVSYNKAALEKFKTIDWSKHFQLTPEERKYISTPAAEDFLKDLEILKEIFPADIFSFIKPQFRKQLWETSTLIHGDKYHILRRYDSWVPLYGEPEKYIYKGHKEINKGWEVIFLPQKTYADFEKQIHWFRTTMGSKTSLFEAPGHNRVVLPQVRLTQKEQTVFEGKVAELNRMLLSYLVLRNLKGETGILGAKHKAIPDDFKLSSLNTGRGPIRLEKNRFYENSLGVEFRVGMKNSFLRHFVQAIYASRLATNDMNYLSKIQDWKLIPASKMTSEDWAFTQYDAAELGVDPEILTKALKNWTAVRKHDKPLPTAYLIPFWNWENAPFLKGKASELQRLRVDFVTALANMQNVTYANISKLISNWASASNLIADIENYMVPKRSFDRVQSPLTVNIKPKGIDVNKIDLGNEFTARMPLKLKADYDSRGQWLQTIYDMSPSERETRIQSFAQALQEKFTGQNFPVTRLASGSHGHNLSIAYELKDAQNRTWRVEWDGVSRNYDPQGNVIDSTARGGHIEIVSPKYNPQLTDIQAVYDTMAEQSLVPDYKMGGSHINIDYEIFEKNPQALARFLTLFHQHRGIISFMFQHINRLRSAEPIEVSSKLDLGLRNFTGTQEDLAQLLYNERYFNQRQSRKTRYTQIDVSNYMGAVIPNEFIKPDFDVVKARFTGGDGWSRQFRVTKHKKLEFRLFDAAKDSLEASLQIKVVRALLNKALNDNSKLDLPVQAVQHEAYVHNPQQAYNDLAQMVKDLGLSYSDYSPFVTNKLVINDGFMRGKYFESWSTRAAREFPKADGWGQALKKARNENEKIFSDSVQKKIENSPELKMCISLF